MAIEVAQVGDHFTVEVTPPHVDWHSPGPIALNDVLAKLGALGCHSTDITDVFDASGANWRADHDAEVRRRHERNA